MEELRDKLLDWAKQFETPDFIKDDPIFFPHKYNDKKDIEISAKKNESKDSTEFQPKNS